MTNAELVKFVKRKIRYSRKTNREPWFEILKILEKDDMIENSPKARLKKKGMTQVELARLLEIEECTVSLYLRGRRTPPEWFNVEIEKVLGDTK